MPTIKAGERIKVLNIISEMKEFDSPSWEQSTSFSSTSQSLPVEIVYINEPCESIESEAVETTENFAMVSSSVRKTVTSAPSSSKTKSSSSAPEQVMHVKQILNQSVMGRNVIRNIREKGWPDEPFRKEMLAILVDDLIDSTGRNKESYYPNKSEKIMMAEGIIRDFPTLADDGKGNGYLAWYDTKTCKGFIGKKLEYAREKNVLKSAEKRKMQKKNCEAANLSPTVTAPDDGEKENEDEESPFKKAKLSYEEMVKKLNRTEATAGSKDEISIFMKLTYTSRRKWIDKPPQPSSDEILTKFIHFTSYSGLLISEEFQRLHPGAVAFELSDIVDAVVEHAKRSKPKLYSDSSCLKNNTVRALQLIFDMLPSVPVKQSKERCLSNEELNNKVRVAAKPCAALVQIAPASTNVITYKNVLQPIAPPSNSKVKQLMSAPYLLWLTDDHETGEVYIKVDNYNINVAVEASVDPFPKVFDVFFKLYFVLNIHYYPQMKHFFNFFEYVYGLNNKPIPTVRSLVGSLRNIQIESNQSR